MIFPSLKHKMLGLNAGSLKDGMSCLWKRLCNIWEQEQGECQLHCSLTEYFCTTIFSLCFNDSISCGSSVWHFLLCVFHEMSTTLTYLSLAGSCWPWFVVVWAMATVLLLGAGWWWCSFKESKMSILDSLYICLYYRKARFDFKDWDFSKFPYFFLCVLSYPSSKWER